MVFMEGERIKIKIIVHIVELSCRHRQLVSSELLVQITVVSGECCDLNGSLEMSVWCLCACLSDNCSD